MEWVPRTSFSVRVRDPFGVVPFVMIETRDDGAVWGGARAERVRIGLKWENVAARAGQSHIVDGAFIELRHEIFQNARTSRERAWDGRGHPSD